MQPKLSFHYGTLHEKKKELCNPDKDRSISSVVHLCSCRNNPGVAASVRRFHDLGWSDLYGEVGLIDPLYCLQGEVVLMRVFLRYAEGEIGAFSWCFFALRRRAGGNPCFPTLTCLPKNPVEHGVFPSPKKHEKFFKKPLASETLF